MEPEPEWQAGASQGGLPDPSPNVPRFSGSPVRATKINPSAPVSKDCRWSVSAWTTNGGSGTVRRPARDFGYGLSVT